MFFRLKRCRLTVFSYILVTSILIILFYGYFYQQLSFFPIAPVTIAPTLTNVRISRHLSKLITVIFRQFEDFENDITESVQSFASAYPNMPIFVISDITPYPPFSFSTKNETLNNVRVLSMDFKLNATPDDMNPVSYVTTEFVLFVPDGARVSRRVLQHATAAAMGSKNAVAIGISGSKLTCQFVRWHYSDWTVQYSKDSSGVLCDAVHGQHALLLRTSLLRTLPQPFVLPLPEALYLQTTVRNIKVQIFGAKFGVGHNMQKTPAAKQHASKRLRENRVALFRKLGIKAVIRYDGNVHWFGCKKETQRCFPSVRGPPSYVLAGRNTPPCCRRNLRTTVNHVLQALITSGARCWLETTSLLGAVVRGDLLPYAEYAEIGVHASDIPHISWLSRGGADADGFVWERATRGRYYRVAFSATNRVYVLILPFVSRNGTMWPDDWVLTNQKQFPERHLHPLAQISFVDKQAPAPNDARAFLDLKLGKNAVERTVKLGAKLLYP